MVHARKYTIHSVCGNGKDLSLVGPIQNFRKSRNVAAGAVFFGFLNQLLRMESCGAVKRDWSYKIMTLNN